jgi:BlaI family transcriptional regulator, penicillinase repressor
MPRPRSTAPTERELDILQVLWNSATASVGEIRAALPQMLAATTVSTMLRVMEGKGLAVRTPDRRWKAAISRQAAGNGLINGLLNRVFEGSAQRLVAQIVEMHGMSADELDELRELLDRYRASSPATRSRTRPGRR